MELDFVNFKNINDDYYHDAISQLWNEEVGFIFPISEKMMKQNIYENSMFEKSSSFLAIQDGKVIGFILAKVYNQRLSNEVIIEKYNNNGFISLFYVSRYYRKQGIGSKLLSLCEESLRKLNVKKISIGSDIDCFFPGIPNDFDNLTDVFVRKRGYQANYYTHDLVCKLSKKELTNNEIQGVTFRYCTSDDKEIVLEFFKKNFYGRWYYEAIEYFDDNDIKEEYLIAIKDNVVIGFLRINKMLINKISYNIMWANRFEKLAGFGPLGVALEHRKNGIGSTLLNIGLAHCYNESYSDVLIDWTGLVAYYQKYGFQVWKCYLYASKTLD